MRRVSINLLIPPLLYSTFTILALKPAPLFLARAFNGLYLINAPPRSGTFMELIHTPYIISIVVWIFLSLTSLYAALLRSTSFIYRVRFDIINVSNKNGPHSTLDTQCTL